MTTKTEEKIEFVQILQREFPNKALAEIRDFSNKLFRLGGKIKRYAEQDCNVGLTDKEIKQDEKNMAKVIELAVSFGCQHVKFSGDPRAATVKLNLPSGYTNDWSHEGVCVPNS